MNLTEATIKALQGKLEGRQIKKTGDKNISRKTEGLEKNRKAYYFEVGVKDFDAEIDRPVPFYKIPYETVDENTGECQTFDEAFGYVNRYIKNGVNSTYGIIVEVDVTEDEYNNIYNGMSDYYDYSYMYEGKLKYSAYKDKNGDYVVAFDDTVDMKLPENKKVENISAKTDKDDLLGLKQYADELKTYIGVNKDRPEVQTRQKELDSILEKLWVALEDVPFIENENRELILDGEYLDFPKGTTRDKIWHWFDFLYSKGVAYLINDFDITAHRPTEGKNIKRLRVSKKIEDVNSSEFNLYIKPEELSDVNKDSLLFDSDTTIADYREGKYLLSLMVRGSVKIENTENGDVYTNYQSFPDDLVELIKTGKLDDSEVYYIDMNNWFEWFLDEVEGNVADTIWYDVADIEGMLNKPTPEENETELEVIMKDLFDDIVSQFKNGSLEESKNMKGKKTENRRVLGEHLKLKEDKELLAEIDDPEELGEDFYEKICRAYIDTLNLEWVAEDKMNGTVVHGFFEDDDYANKHKSEVNNDNFSDIYYGQYTEKEIEDEEPDYGVYQGWENFYYDYVEDGIKEDMEDIGVYSDGTSDYMAGVNHWDFYISEEDLIKLGLWNEDMKAEFLGESKKIEADELSVKDRLYNEVARRYKNLDDLCKRLGDENPKIYEEDKVNLQAILDVFDGVVLDEGKKVTESKTWDEIFKDAEGTTFGQQALKVKDQARAEVEELMRKDGIDVDNLESVEDEIEKYVADHNIRFADNGCILDENKKVTESLSDDTFETLNAEIHKLPDSKLDYKGMCSLIAGYIAGIVGVEDNKEAMAKVNIDTVKEIADAVFNEDDVWEPMDDFIYSEIYDKLGIN